ncbi:MAG: FecR domain-containing protein [Betaproteobacteria bacterium]|nr:FecR domain-containing protein [Betaproteobacteria bacterium]
MRIKLIKRLVCLCLGLPLIASAQSTATVTILEGEAALLRGTTRYALLEGVRLAPADIVQTADKTFARVEFADGSRVDLGPKTRLLNAVAPAARGAKSGGTNNPFLLSGLMKFSAGKSANAGYRYTTPHFTVTTSDSVTVVQVAATEASVFLESGEIRLAEAGPKVSSAPQRLKTGEFYSRRNGQKSTVIPRPSQTFLGALPRGFLDTIPSRLSRYKNREVAPKRAEEITYPDVEAWLKTNRDVRRPLVQRWRSRASDPAFRTALIANLKDHPEWDPILFPEKYKPKEEQAPLRAPESAQAR